MRERIPQARFRAALRRELEWEAARLGRRRLTSIFFGGGTPSLMEPETVAVLIADAQRLFEPADEMEITLEANPTSVEAERFAAFRDAGVNRVSIGVQSLDGAALRMLGRQHSAAQAIAALETARAIFPRISFDLIYARPGQTLVEWRAELRQALDLAADHLSLYQLTIEPGTKFEAMHRRGEIVLPDDDTAVALYEATAEEAGALRPAGLRGVELCGAGQREPAQPHLLALWRLCRHRARRAWPDHPVAARHSRPRGAIVRPNPGPNASNATGTARWRRWRCSRPSAPARCC